MNPAPHYETEQRSATATQLLNQILAQAYQAKASDIHIKPQPTSWRIRFRIDGLLTLYQEMDLQHLDAMITRIKILAKMDIAERRLPQDGKFQFHLSSNICVEYRVSTLPTILGKKIALRPFEATSNIPSLEAIGFEQEQIPLIQHALKQQNGLILVTGPTESGKTLSLYTFLKMLNYESINICTLEDPTEILMNGL